jgi:hypothetical protein
MAYTKRVSKHDRISIDGTDVSNAFREFGLSSTKTTEDASGFSVSGVDETLPGATAQTFTGEFFITEEITDLLWPLHINDTVVEIQWQPNGLVDSTATVFYGNCTINEFSPTDTRGSPSTSPFTATTADEDGIQAAAGT